MRLSILLLALIASGCASVPTDPNAPARACIRADNLRAWNPISSTALEVRDRAGQHYRVELREPCPELFENREIALLESRPMHWPIYARYPYGWRGYAGWGRPYGPWHWADPFGPYWVERQSFFSARVCGGPGEVVAFPRSWGGLGATIASCRIRAIYRLPMHLAAPPAHQP